MGPANLRPGEWFEPILPTRLALVLQLRFSMCPGHRACFESSELTLNQGGCGS
ncbi:hypothetical protein Strvi_4580 [Streptomyces violaceusniger Tu 4113]|uniref:Uncharacterized protein n=1 Tax=Streptomyces violaceusniger (strain Tu 4113) TaxID=653045 RepID=G2P502_STRV4|nr:hypothetical protein Strvi_4580 [Streptomyces violaceusniger Tu 4113]